MNPIIDGRGLTPLKISLEYLVGLGHLIGIGFIIYDYRRDKHSAKLSLILAMGFLFISELVFTLYSNVYDFDNLLGHLYKILGYYFLLKGIYVVTLEEPFLKQREAEKKAEEMMIQSEKLSAVGQLAAGIAHEIRNPLTSLKGFVQLIQSGLSSNKEYYQIMLSEIERIQIILNELLILAKPQSIHFEKKKIENILSHVATLLYGQAVIYNIQIVEEYEAELPLILCEENRLKQVFINVIKNAMEAMPSGGEIIVQAKKQDDRQLLIRVIDQGQGIDADKIEKLGTPFFTTKKKGTGLGLMICYKIIEEHQGKLLINSKKGEGTTVEIFLPLKITLQT